MCGRGGINRGGAVRCGQCGSLEFAHRVPGGRAPAQEILGAMYVEGYRDPETVGMYAASWWVRYPQSKDKRHLQRSRDLYLEAFKLDPQDSTTGINAASKSLFLGE